MTDEGVLKSKAWRIAMWMWMWMWMQIESRTLGWGRKVHLTTLQLLQITLRKAVLCTRIMIV